MLQGNEGETASSLGNDATEREKNPDGPVKLRARDEKEKDNEEKEKS